MGDLGPLIELVARLGLTVTESSPGAPDAPAWLLFSSAGEGLEFLLHTGHHLAYTFGDNVALTLVHPDGAAEFPRAKVSWVPTGTEAILTAWRHSFE